MTTSDKKQLFREMQEHPENYSDEQLEAMMADIDRKPDTEAAWQRLEKSVENERMKNASHLRLQGKGPSPRSPVMGRASLTLESCAQPLLSITGGGGGGSFALPPRSSPSCSSRAWPSPPFVCLRH